MFRRDRRGTTGIEFAIIGLFFFPMLFGAIEVGLLMWTRNTLQAAAEQTARCVALGSSQCSSGPAYAVSLATNWIGAAVITTSNVTVVKSAASCNGQAGSFTTVAITSTAWNHVLPPPFTSNTLNVKACFPS